MFVNLLQNAIKFSRANAQAVVGWQVRSGDAVAHVRDTGIGISEDDLPRVFERFYKVDKSRVYTTDSGTGLGLAIVKHLANALGARVGATSTPGAGSDFFIVLPLAKTAGTIDNQVPEPARLGGVRSDAS
jgi:two-component system phosphate regulon sensor histidine kinase PhoR